MIAWLHSIRVRSQVAIAIAVVPVVLALLGLSVVPQAVRIALADDVDQGTLREAVRAVRYAMGVVVVCGFITALGAAALLRTSLRSTVDSIRAATEAIASGDFAHRIASPRADELGDLARAVDTTAVRLHRLEQARRQMLACVSHELRTPLTIARNMAFTLGKRSPDPARADQFAQLDEELERLGALIGDLVDAASVHAGGVRLARERTDLVELVRDAAERFRVQAEARDVRVVVRSERVDRRRGVVDVDVDRVQQVLGNLLANAVRHCHVGSVVDVTIRSGERDGGQHEVLVANAGERIPDVVARSIFEPFFQHGPRTGRVGLGLAIARDLAEAHGGSLELDARLSEAACGACFALRLPAAAPTPRVDAHIARFGSPSRVRYAT